MKIGPKYKIARRLGAPVFEKTQTQKYLLSQSRKEKTSKFRRPKSEFGIQLLEKQKARYTYCLTERQFSKYAKEAVAKKNTNSASGLLASLESRADNIAYRAGFATTRLGARQLVSHGHVLLNGKRLTIPSAKLSVGDVLSLREASKTKPLFAKLDENMKEREKPVWLEVSLKDKTAKVISVPKFDQGELQFDLNAVLEFYSR